MTNTIKMVEIRDRGTLIPAYAIEMIPRDDKERYLMRHCGYRSVMCPCFLLISIQQPSYSAKCSDEWPDNSRTMRTAHKYIEENFDSIQNGDVIDVEFILGEVDKPCESNQKEIEQELLNALSELEGKDE